jgi:predicted cobalt transporter CbtA
MKMIYFIFGAWLLIVALGFDLALFSKQWWMAVIGVALLANTLPQGGKSDG